MDNNIKNTKKKLTIIFSIIVFVVVLLLWILFFSIKYFKEINIENSEFSNLNLLIDKWNLTYDDLNNLWPFINKKGQKFKNPNNKNNILWVDDQKFKPRWFINFVLLDNKWGIISSNIIDDIDNDFINQIYVSDKYLNQKQYNWFLIEKKILENHNYLLVFKKLRYSLIDYFNDILGFTLIAFIFWIFIYFIWWLFVNKAFIPVEENMKDMKNFIHNAGHELKTPISVIDSNIQLIDDLKIYDPVMTKELKDEVIRLNSIIDSLIRLSNLDLFKNIEKNSLHNSISHIIKEFNFKISEKNIITSINIDKNIKIKANKDYFYIFLSNIIWNAIKYNINWWAINISYINNELIISDSWIGISEKDLNKIFDRFFKADKSRKSEWFGIGLSLVKKISEIYSWKINVVSNENKWTDFIVKF